MGKFKVVSEYTPSGDQPQAIDTLASGIENGLRDQVLLGVTGSGKTYTMAKVIERVQRPTLVLAHNKTLAAQLCEEFRAFFPENAVEYFISYYDYYQPEAYIAQTDTYIEKDSAINDEIERLRHSATSALSERRDVIVVSSVSCIYGLGDPIDYKNMVISLRPGMEYDRDELMRKLTEIRYERNDLNFVRNAYRVRGDTLEVYPAYWSGRAIRIEFFGDEIDRISEVNAVTGEGIPGVSFLLYDSGNNPIAQETSDDRGYVRFEGLEDGRYYLRELENEGYIPDTQKKTVYVKSGETTEIEWKNTPITGQIQIVKTSADYNSMNGWPAGTPIPNTVFEVYNARTNRLMDTIKTDKNGLAVSKPLPLARYKIVESKAAEFYGLDKTPIEVEIEHAGQIVKASMTNKSLYTNVSIKKTGYVEVMPGQLVRYNFTGIANNSTTALESFYWRDTLPVKAVRLEKIYTGTWNTPGNYKIVYRTNLSGDTWRTLVDNLSTSKNYVLDASPAALGLAANEYVTEFMAAFGIVPANFRQVEAPRVDCKALAKLTGGTQFVNTSDAGGVYNGQWIMATSRWVTRVYAPSKPLPRTGY